VYTSLKLLKNALNLRVGEFLINRLEKQRINMASNLLSLSNPVFVSYAFYGGVVLAKMMGMSFLTAVKRIGLGIFANPEDVSIFGQKKVILDHESVERVRRNHLNDLENIPAFLLVGLLYVSSNPAPSAALWHFRVFAASRVLHTLFYQLGVQPFRGMVFGVGMFTTLSMLFQVIASTM